MVSVVCSFARNACSSQAKSLLTNYTTMKKTVRFLAVAFISASLFVPFLSQAENVDTSTGTGKSVVSSWIEALDGKGDSNAIGKFKSAKENKKYKSANGVVSAVSDTSISITKGEKTYTFIVDEKTTVLRKFKGKATIGEITLGDTVSIWATAKTDGTAKIIWDRSIWRISLKGTVSGLDTAAGTFNVVIQKKEPHTGLFMTLTVPVQTNSATTYFIGDTAAAFTDLVDGQTVTVRGTWNIEGKYEIASKVTIAE